METTYLPPGIQHAVADHIPLIWVDPPASNQARRMVIWIPDLAGRKEHLISQLRDLAAAGFVALSFDPWQHGERTAESQEHFQARIGANVRRHLWPILGQTAEEVPRVIDWAIDHLKVSPRVRLGGVSMGGDIAVTASGLDRRIEVVAAVISTPDWLRSGSDLPTGTPDTYARNFYTRLNPLTNLDAYTHRPAITFQNGERDTLSPPDGPIRFRAALNRNYINCPMKLDVTLHAGVGHEFTAPMWQNCLRWFATPF